MGLRPVRYRDAREWREVRARNDEWLRPWEPTPPPPFAVAPLTFRQMVRRLSAQARAGEAFPWIVTYDERLAGQMTVAGIVRGSAQLGHVGYWVDQQVAGRGVAPTALAMAIDHCLFVAGLHRIEVNIRPENRASLRVVEKLGLRPEGLRPRYLHIDGAWRDHVCYAVTAEEVPGGLLRRWHQTRTPSA